jgi:hypothetical protein
MKMTIVMIHCNVFATIGSTKIYVDCELIVGPSVHIFSMLADELPYF